MASVNGKRVGLQVQRTQDRQRMRKDLPMEVRHDSSFDAGAAVHRMHVGTTLSEAAIYRGTVYLAGQVANDTTQNIEGQTREVLSHVDRLLADAGSSKSRILMCQIFLADMKDFEAMNQVWSNWVPAGDAPPRATVEAKLAKPAWLVEVVVTAAVA